MRYRKRHAPMTGGRSGFTFIELLVAMAIGVFVMAGLVGMLRSNRTAYSLTEQMRSLEENGRVAADYMAREIRPMRQESMMALDNGDPGYGAVQTSLGAKNGTDILRLFVSVNLIDPIYIGDNPVASSAYNPTSANLKFDAIFMGGFPGYDPSMSNNAISDLLGQYSASIYNCYADAPHAPVSYAEGAGDCSQDITPTGTGPTADMIKLVFNRGNDSANQPHDCDGGPGAAVGVSLAANTASGKAQGVCVSIGGESYFYIRSDDPGNRSGAAIPQLVYYNTALATREVVANNVEDMQIEYGLDTNDDDIIDLWADGRSVGDPRQVKAIKVQYLMVTTTIDQDKSQEAPPFLSNSSIATTGVADLKRRRVITRTTRLRNAL